MPDLKYVRKQLAFILKAVRHGSRSEALDAIQRLADGLDHVEAALEAPNALESKPDGLTVCRAAEAWFMSQYGRNDVKDGMLRAALVPLRLIIEEESK